MGYIGKVKDTAGNTHLVGSTLYGTCPTATATAAKVVTCPDYVEEVEGVTIHVHFTNKNTNGCTLNVNNKGAHTCVSAAGNAGTWEDDSVVSFTLVNDNNTLYWYQNNMYWEDTNTDTKVKQAATTTNENYPLLFKNTSNRSEVTDQVRFGSDINAQMTANPSTGRLNAITFNGIGMRTLTGGGFELSNSAGVIAVLKVHSGADYDLGDACEKDVVPTLSTATTSTDLPTAQAVVDYVDTAVHAAVSGAAKLQGTLVQTDSGSSSTKWTQAELEAASYKSGWYWVVETAGTYAGNVMEVGDMLFCVSDKSGTTYAASDFAAIQNNIETLTNPEITTIWTNAVPVS